MSGGLQRNREEVCSTLYACHHRDWKRISFTGVNRKYRPNNSRVYENWHRLTRYLDGLSIWYLIFLLGAEVQGCIGLLLQKIKRYITVEKELGEQTSLARQGAARSQFSSILLAHSLGRILNTEVKGCSSRNSSAKLSRVLSPTDTGLELGYSTFVDNSEMTHTNNLII